MARSYDELIEEAIRYREQYRKRELELRKRKSAEERKKRTHRLIELGAIVETVLGRATTEEDKERLLSFLNRQERNGHFFTKAMNEKMPADNGSKDDE